MVETFGFAVEGAECDGDVGVGSGDAVLDLLVAAVRLGDWAKDDAAEG